MRESYAEVASAADSLKKRGSAIVIEHAQSSGSSLEAFSTLVHRVFCDLLPNGNDFQDGAVVICGLMWQAKAFLPMLHSVKLSRNMGHTRCGWLTDQTDALVVVVSEERGTISIVYAGQIRAV